MFGKADVEECFLGIGLFNFADNFFFVKMMPTKRQ